MESYTVEDVRKKFHELEKQSIGYDNYIDAEEKNYLKTLDGWRELIQNV